MLGRLFAFSMILYVATVVLINIGFSYIPMIETPIGWVSPMAVVVGAVFVIRDFAQRTAGHLVLVAMAVATLFSYLLADPYVAIASAAAFATSELADWFIYTVTKKPFHQRVLVSSLISAPIDTAVFLFGISGFTVGTFVLMVASKLVAAFIIWGMYRERLADPQSDEAEDDVFENRGPPYRSI